MTVTAAHPTPLTQRSARTAFWAFLGSFVAFIGVIIVSLLLANPDYQTALYDRAEELGVNQNHVPAAVIAELTSAHPDPVWALLATAGLFLTSGALVAVGVSSLGGAAGRSGGVGLGAGLALGGGVAMAVVTFLPAMLAGGSGWLADNWWVYMTLVDIAVVATSLAVILGAVAVRAAGLARRTALVVIALCALVIVAQILSDAPPIVPMLLGSVLAFTTMRALRES